MTALASEPRTVSRIVLPNEPTWEESLIAAIPAGVDDKCRFAPIEEMEYCFEGRGSSRTLEANEFRIALPQTNLENHSARAPLDLQRLIQILKDLRQVRANELGTYATCPPNAAYFIEGLGLLAAGGKLPARDAFDTIWRMVYSARALIRKKGDAWVEVKLDLASPDGLLKIFGVTGVYPEKVREFDELLESAFKEVDRRRPRPALRVVPKEAPPLPADTNGQAPPVSPNMLIVKPASGSPEPTGDDLTCLAEDARLAVTPEQSTSTAEIFRKIDRHLAAKKDGEEEEKENEDEDEGDEGDEDDEEEDEVEETPPDSVQSRIPGNLGTFNFYGSGPVTLNFNYGGPAPDVTPPAPVATPPAPPPPALTPPPSPSPLPRGERVGERVTPPPTAAKPAVEEPTANKEERLRCAWCGEDYTRKNERRHREKRCKKRGQPGELKPPVSKAEPTERKPAPILRVRAQQVPKVGSTTLRCGTCDEFKCGEDIPIEGDAWKEHCRVHLQCGVDGCGRIFTAKTQDLIVHHPADPHSVCQHCGLVVLEKDRSRHNETCK